MYVNWNEGMSQCYQRTSACTGVPNETKPLLIAISKCFLQQQTNTIIKKY